MYGTARNGRLQPGVIDLGCRGFTVLQYIVSIKLNDEYARDFVRKMRQDII